MYGNYVWKCKAHISSIVGLYGGLIKHAFDWNEFFGHIMLGYLLLLLLRTITRLYEWDSGSVWIRCCFLEEKHKGDPCYNINACTMHIAHYNTRVYIKYCFIETINFRVMLKSNNQVPSKWKSVIVVGARFLKSIVKWNSHRHCPSRSVTCLSSPPLPSSLRCRPQPFWHINSMISHCIPWK